MGRGQAALGVILSQVTLPRAALGDGILTARGDEAAYIAGARWLTPAVLMFQEDVQNAFATRATTVRLIDRGQLGAATALLRLDVTEFDARYDPTAGGAPTVVVSLRATLTRADGRQLLQQVFTERRPAAQDRVSAIVQAYDAAVQGVMAQAVDWTQAHTPVIAAELDPAAPTALPPPPVRASRRLPQ
ncbi:ABC-type transport auxiliary lipoprotein family protein [Caulobacter sp. S45]|uniref:ABC-type transport auxiliary lipoprotein family protein n=1 Tax=Caulobacter sp. S45 TaxID=1641861 RepID=UPI0015754E73|nr:ABC-type transport auxiliary lipoprotein family protein [Caulobacter sp. S45]